MAGADYEIVARLVVQDASQRGIGSVLTSLGVIQGRANGVAQSIGAQFRNMFAGLAGAYGIGRLTAAVGQFQVQMQDATVGLATSMAVINRSSMSDGMTRARKVIQDLRKDARDLPGEFQDYFKGYQQIYAPVRQRGGSDETVRQLVKDTIMAGMANNRQGNLSLSFGEATRDVTQALTTGVSFRQTPIVAQALMAQGLSLQAFRQMKPEKQLETLSKAMHAYSVGAQEFNKTFSVQASTLKDNVLFALSNFASPIFERVTENVRSINQWFARSNDELQKMVDGWGPRLLDLWDNLISKAGTYAALIAAAGLTPSVAGGAMSAGRKFRETRNDFRELMLMSGGGGGGAAVAARGALAGVGASALGPLLAVFAALAIAILSLKGALAEGGVMVAFVKHEITDLFDSCRKLGDTFGMLTREGSAFNSLGDILLFLFGGIVGAADLLVRSLSTVVLAFGMLFNVATAFAAGVYSMATGDMGGVSDARTALKGLMSEGKGRFKDIWSDWGGKKNSKVTDDERFGSHGMRLNGGTVPSGPQTNVHLNGPITIAVKAEVNADPTRVAYTIGSVLEQLGRNRQQARRIPVPIGG